jgi:hypothetical protein
MQNNNCDGNGPHVSGEVRMLPTGGGGNAILCRACFRREMAYRFDRNLTLGLSEKFAIPDWSSLEIYGLEE